MIPLASRWKPIVGLCLLSPLLTELLTTNIPASVYFRPATFVLLATVGYGIPILLCREAAVRWGGGLATLIALGLVYGLYNEALIAKTVVSPDKLPVEQLDGYGVVGRFAVPWTLLILWWHAWHALIYPVAIVLLLTRAHSKEPWLGDKTFAILAVAILAFGIAAFFAPSDIGVRGKLTELPVVLMAMALLVLLARSARRIAPIGETGESRMKWIFWGMGLSIAGFIVPLILGGAKSPPTVFGLYFVALAVTTVVVLRRVKSASVATLVLLAIGDYSVNCAFVLLSAFQKHSMERMVSSVAFLLAFAIGAFLLRPARASLPVMR